MTPLILRGMHGIGDNLHQRAVVRELMRENDLWLRTSWPQLYLDFAGLGCLPLKSPLRWMEANEERMAHLFEPGQPPPGAREISCSYPPELVKETGSVLGAMAKVCGVPVGDFRLPVPDAWLKKARGLVPADRPTLVYRPLVARVESRGYAVRNPDAEAYAALFRAARENFYVVSVADILRDREWLVGPRIEADAEFHAGELEIETVAALVSLADLVFCSPGFMVVLAQAVGTPAVCVFGGFEGKESFSAGARYSPWLPIEPIAPCPCWSHDCIGDKTVDLDAARARIVEFIGAHAP